MGPLEDPPEGPPPGGSPGGPPPPGDPLGGSPRGSPGGPPGGPPRGQDILSNITDTRAVTDTEAFPKAALQIQVMQIQLPGQPKDNRASQNDLQADPWLDRISARGKVVKVMK